MLDEIVSSISAVTEMASDIAQSSQEQSQGVNEITRAISQINVATQQNSAGAAESASAAEELSAQAHMLKNAVQALVVTVEGERHKVGWGYKNKNASNNLRSYWRFYFNGSPINYITQNHFLSLEIFELLELKPRPKYLDESFLCELYLNKGLRLRQISNKLGVSRKVVRKQLSSQNIDIKKTLKTPVSGKVLRMIQKMRLEGISYQKIKKD